jgi:hypothetical protein
MVYIMTIRFSVGILLGNELSVVRVHVDGIGRILSFEKEEGTLLMWMGLEEFFDLRRKKEL